MGGLKLLIGRLASLRRTARRRGPPSADIVAAKPSRRFRPAEAVALVPILALAPGAAAAMTANCIWNLVPAKVQRDVVVAYETGRSEALDPAMKAAFGVVAGKVGYCLTVPSEREKAKQTADAVGFLLIASAREAAAGALLAKRGVPAALLDRVWDQEDVEVRYQLRLGVLDALNTAKPMSKTAHRAIELISLHAIQASDGKADMDKDGAPYIDYFTSRAVREIMEERY